ncbi:unnamed protein product [Dracunculus medinensis]|uniref:J domain-containing protein n=1 Tax=Dracunculus medinensis TaxID=318479 RepID=A0A3P7Q1C0_DRAME|nr:unnamed protein product [Dracunculus medinensis]
MAMQYHPDRVQDKKVDFFQEKKAYAEELFRKVATAYEVLKDDETRNDYNYYLDHPEERMYNYYQYYRRRVSPKVDVRIVIVATIVIISIIQFLSARHKYQEALEYAVKQEKYRNRAREIAYERGIVLNDRTIKDKKWRKENEEQIIRKIIEENMDIRGGYSKPSVFDTLFWTILVSPITFCKYIIWNCEWIIKYWIKKEDYDIEAKFYLIRKYMGISEEQFNCLEDEERLCFLDAELWVKAKFDEWKMVKEEEQKQKLAASGRYKRYRRYMRNQAGSTISFVDE